jgi:hypothetical protein
MLIVAWVMSDPVNCELRLLVRLDLIAFCPLGGRTTPPNQVQLASSTGDDIRLLVRLDLIAFLPVGGWKNNSSKSSSTGQFDRPPNQVRSTGQFDWLIRLANGYRNPHLLPTAMIRSWRDPCSTGQNCELMDPSSDLIALLERTQHQRTGVRAIAVATLTDRSKELDARPVWGEI